MNRPEIITQAIRITPKVSTTIYNDNSDILKY